MTWINWYGLEFVAAIMIPNIAFAMTHRDGFENLFRNRTVEVLEQIGRFGCFFLMVIQPETLCRDDWFTGATQGYLWLGAALGGGKKRPPGRRACARAPPEHIFLRK